MTQYVKSTSFASKDALPQGNPLKIVKGTEIDTEFNNIAIAVETKADLLNPVFTGVPKAATATAGTSTTQLATTAFAVSAGTPTASLLMWPTATAPTGFLLCNGQAVSRATYAALFAIVGVVFGTGDGSTTFTLPNYIDRMPVGAGSLYVANSQGGSKDAVLVSHTHTATVTDPSHVHGSATGSGFISNGGGESLAGGGDLPFGRPITTATAVTGITVANSTEGVSGTNANLPPYLGIFFIIKT
jgi:microcystin-dependent protein